MTSPRADDEPLLRFAAGAVEWRRAGQETHTQRLDFAAVRAKPFLKWTGGKQWLAPIASQLEPPNFAGRYYEPFLGGGAVFFARPFRSATLSDLNDELIITYRAVRDAPLAVMAMLRTYPHDKDFFLALRSGLPTDATAVAARMIYLNKTAFNGMYRVNTAGAFNVPFGRYRNPTICNESRILAASAALAGTELYAADFEFATSQARPGDFVFMDPPYITGHHNNGFRKYNASLFSWDDQLRLSRVAQGLAARGVTVVVANANHSALRALYSGFSVLSIERRSLINGSPAVPVGR